jgi:hypothetical protein
LVAYRKVEAAERTREARESASAGLAGERGHRAGLARCVSKSPHWGVGLSALRSNTLRFLPFLSQTREAAMRLYFHLVASGNSIQDLEGIEVTDPGQAQIEANDLIHDTDSRAGSPSAERARTSTSLPST